MLTKEETQELQLQARNNVRSKLLAERFNKTQHNIELEYWLSVHTGYSADAAHAKFIADAPTIEADLVKSELQLLIQQREREHEGESIAWRLIQETFVPVSEDGFEPLRGEWSAKFTDPQTKKKTPSLLEIAKQQMPAMCDAMLALNSPSAFKSKLIEKYELKACVYRFGESMSSERMVIFRFRTRRFPPNA